MNKNNCLHSLPPPVYISLSNHRARSALLAIRRRHSLVTLAKYSAARVVTGVCSSQIYVSAHFALCVQGGQRPKRVCGRVFFFLRTMPTGGIVIAPLLMFISGIGADDAYARHRRFTYCASRKRTRLKIPNDNRVCVLFLLFFDESVAVVPLRRFPHRHIVDVSYTLRAFRVLSQRVLCVRKNAR